jgi:hypothetical protein
MSENDVVTLKSNYENWVKERVVGLSEDINPFNFYCIEQFLKPYPDLSDDDILYGYTDGTHDGGVDALYFLVDKKLIREDTALEPRSEARVNLLIFQIKDSDGGYGPNEINKLYFFTDNLLNILREAKNFRLEYHQQLIDIMNTFKEKYRIIGGERPSLSIDYYYITRADELTPNKAAQDAIDRVKQTASKHFNKAKINFHCVNAQRLLEQVDLRPSRTKTLLWSVTPMATIEESYVGLVNLRKYYEFLLDKDGRLDELMLEENVRGYQGDVSVNKGIGNTLREDKDINFWLLNNGITIITPDASSAGYHQLNLEDPQIVNGLQTSRVIYEYFKEHNPTDETRSILVKVIQTAEAAVQDKIIIATNSQTALEKGSLRAAYPIHHRIEAYFKANDLFYERRKKFYKDKRVPIAQTVSRTELTQAMVSVLLQRPDEARRRPSDYLTVPEKYDAVYGQDYKLREF